MMDLQCKILRPHCTWSHCSISLSRSMCIRVMRHENVPNSSANILFDYSLLLLFFHHIKLSNPTVFPIRLPVSVQAPTSGRQFHDVSRC